VLVTAACGGSATAPDTTSTPTNPGAGFPSATLSLTASPIAQSAIRWITPLGNLNPPGHTLPTNHIYFYIANPNGGESFTALRTPFYAPGSGTVTFVIGGGVGQESKIMVRQTSSMSYYVDHVIVSSPVAVGTVVTAGQVLGTSGLAYAVDLGVINDALNVPFLAPSRYPDSESLHGDVPLKYFSDPLRSQLYARVQRLGPELDGAFNYDSAGRLSGNWFSSVDGSPISFCNDTYDPSRALISIASGSTQGVYGISASDPAPRDVSAASGKVIYTLARTQSGANPPIDSVAVYLLVQLTDDTHIRTEFFSARPADFTSAARVWAR